MTKQYQLIKEHDFENLRFCLDNYDAYWFYVRQKGASGGEVQINQDLTDKTLDFKKNKKGLTFFIDSAKVFNFSLKNYQKGFILEYEDAPESSVLRSVLDNYLLEIAFKGKIKIKFHSWRDKGAGWKYWNVVK